jgi:HemY protein
MRAVLLSLSLGVWVAAVSTVVAVVANRPGDVSIEWLGRRIDAPMWFVLAAIGTLLVVASLLWQLWRFIVRSPRQLAHQRQDRRRHRAYKALTQGMVAVAAGDASEAQRQSKLAGTLLNDPPLTLLLEAQAAQLGGDEEAAARYFRAMLDRPETAFLGLRGLLMQSLKSGNDAEALKLARRAAGERPQAAWAVSAVLDLELKTGAWAEAAATLKRAEKLKAIDTAAARRRRAVLLVEQARTADDLETAVGQLREAVRLAPDLVPARALLASALARSGRGREAGRLIEQGWTAAPHPELAAAYIQIDPAEEHVARVRRFERLAGFNPNHRESQVALAAANLAAGLWGPARGDLEKALVQAGGEAAAPQRLARLMAHLEEGEAANPAAARHWLIVAARAPADPAWTCDRCGTIAATWTASCERCGGFDSLAWRATPRPAALALDGALPAVPASSAPPPPLPAAHSAPPHPPRRTDTDIAPVDAARRVN